MGHGRALVHQPSVLLLLGALVRLKGVGADSGGGGGSDFRAHQGALVVDDRVEGVDEVERMVREVGRPAVEDLHPAGWPPDPPSGEQVRV